MPGLPEEGRDDPAFPRLRHWVIAAGLLFLVTLIAPVMAGLT
ncbi:hypothetical protein BV98_002381 [Sphingobium herbicidovorans NBRC 16415]|jgi:hypothetical protein|uniref:Uncharacterized protein n=1 Tax=Sphingobium herbicidovorans (strain ATCC 700291 / DSM 11019 / CCUG 56400 / KCTC 2939 / LMG 18315 / NBRC 16415 / MH) TaxID=1219045 RepID=A0A086P858_SPHHM|nr:hypothetical protein [Sphingobium herbicidovorans]KFG89576.1 hypothetical protein BV98_002381 [Sphingobium herbicidovorans NBRC 16415]